MENSCHFIIKRKVHSEGRATNPLEEENNYLLFREESSCGVGRRGSIVEMVYCAGALQVILINRKVVFILPCQPSSVMAVNIIMVS